MAGKKTGAGLPLQPPKLEMVPDLAEATAEALRSVVSGLWTREALQHEATIVVNGKTLTRAQAVTIRVALSGFFSDMAEPNALGDDDAGEHLAKSYWARSGEILVLLAETTSMEPDELEMQVARAVRAEEEVDRLTALIERSAEKLTDFMGRCIGAETALRDYDRELEAISRIVTDGPDTVDARHMAEQDLPVIRKRHAEALRLAGL